MNAWEGRELRIERLEYCQKDIKDWTIYSPTVQSRDTDTLWKYLSLLLPPSIIIHTHTRSLFIFGPIYIIVIFFALLYITSSSPHASVKYIYIYDTSLVRIYHSHFHFHFPPTPILLAKLMDQLAFMIEFF